MGNEEFQQSSKSSTDEHGGVKNSSEKKSQDSQKLIDSQEKIFLKVFEIFSQSSPSTNVGDFEDVVLSDPETRNPANDTNPKPSSTYDLRSRTVTKQHTKKGTSEGQNTKRRKNKSQRNSNENDEMETCSQESVSLLQGCYTGNDFPELLQTCINLNLEMTTDDVENVWSKVNKVDNSTQTEFPLLLSGEREKEITKHTKFVGCVVRLKAILSSKDKTGNAELQDVLQTIAESEECVDERVPVSKETLGYILRSSDAENVFRETVQTLLFYLDDILKEDFVQAAAYWRNSVYEMAVDMLTTAVDSDPGIRKMVELFLCGILESISNNECSKNLVQESKTMLVMTFCKSTYFSFASVQYIIGQLKRLKTKPQDGSSLAEKASRSCFVKNSYLLLRILEVSLESIKCKVKELDKILNKEQEVKNFNVLEMWKKQWRGNEGSDVEASCQWKDTISKWCDELDEVLINCVTHFPISAMAVERCKRLVMDILKNCNPEKRKNEIDEWIL